MIAPGPCQQVLFINNDVVDILLLQRSGTCQSRNTGTDNECIRLLQGEKIFANTKYNYQELNESNFPSGKYLNQHLNLIFANYSFANLKMLSAAFLEAFPPSESNCFN